MVEAASGVDPTGEVDGSLGGQETGAGPEVGAGDGGGGGREVPAAGGPFWEVPAAMASKTGDGRAEVLDGGLPCTEGGARDGQSIREPGIVAGIRKALLRDGRASR